MFTLVLTVVGSTVTITSIPGFASREQARKDAERWKSMHVYRGIDFSYIVMDTTPKVSPYQI